MMTPEVWIAGGTVVASLTTVGGLVAWIARLVRGPLENRVDRLADDLGDVQKLVQHNRGNADTKVQALDIRVQRNTDDIVTLGKADVEHALANGHLREMVAAGFSNIEKRLDELIEGKRGKR